MPEIPFDIIDYMSGLTAFVLDRSVFVRIARDRGVLGVTEYEELTQEQKDLLLADILYTVCCSPNQLASVHEQHGNYSRTIGTQIVKPEELMHIYQGIYDRYDEQKEFGTVRWLDADLY